MQAAGNPSQSVFRSRSAGCANWRRGRAVADAPDEAFDVGEAFDADEAFDVVETGALEAAGELAEAADVTPADPPVPGEAAFPPVFVPLDTAPHPVAYGAPNPE